MTAVLIAGALAAKPSSGGEAWVRLSWVLGFAQLGCDVWFVEEVASASPDAVAWFDAVTRDFGLADRSSLLGGAGRTLSRRDRADAMDFARNCDLLVNISGNLRCPELLAACRRRAFVDLDPGYTQAWAEQGLDVGVEGHHLYFSVAERLGHRDCLMPTAGFNWLPARQPVLLSEWPPIAAGRPERFTTVATWRTPFGPLQIGDRRFGMKAHEFRKLADLPRVVDADFELAADLQPADDADRRLLEAAGWKVTDADTVAGDPDSFRRFVQESGAEVSPAQPVYVETRSGWFSDRSTRYLASGRPVLVQETGLDEELSGGEGVIAFSDLDSAAAGARHILSDYATHAAAARRLAETCFASEVVLAAFLDRAGV